VHPPLRTCLALRQGLSLLPVYSAAERTSAARRTRSTDVVLMGGPGVLYIGVAGSLSVEIASTRRGDHTDVLKTSKIHSRKKVGKRLKKSFWPQTPPHSLEGPCPFASKSGSNCSPGCPLPPMRVITPHYTMVSTSILPIASCSRSAKRELKKMYPPVPPLLIFRHLRRAVTAPSRPTTSSCQDSQREVCQTSELGTQP
jgi:hypothetical protein